ncbi:hypothetical protein R1flu_017670 [Riccia fluitans]|uniref:Uncharacterized protein n=1 Tax=Riccia fluitans TaxID=41844 RepID=A0ABD1ZDU3_9MARC
MQTIRYNVPRPWPQGFSLVEAVEVNKCEFSPTKVTEHVGRVGIIPRTWYKERQDWYVDILDFVCIRTVQRQKEKILGPFRYVSGIENFVLLEDFKRNQFWFPKFLRQDKENDTFFSSTAIWIWMFGCYCKALQGQNEAYPPGCFCLNIFNRGLCIQCSYRPDLHRTVAIDVVADSQALELEPANVDETLSQNICLCKDIFGSEKQCFCGYGLPTEKHEGARPGSDEKELSGTRGDGKSETAADTDQVTE